MLGLVSMAARADHIIGGEMYYSFLGKNGNNNRYRITLKLFVRCDASNEQFDERVDISIYSGQGGLVTTMRDVGRENIERYTATDVDPCIINPPYICYQIGYYSTIVELTPNADGYVAAFQRCCRRTGLANIFSDNTVGATYSVVIPGTPNGFDANNGPRFSKEKGVIVCANNRFSYDYSAEDPDDDSLVYSFTTAYSGATQNNPKPVQAAAPPYSPVSYRTPFSADQPLGDKVTIDQHTGIISGIAPRSGLYIVTVTAKEYRDGVYIGENKKEFQFTVESCVKQVVASTQDQYMDCQSFTINFTNNSTPNKPYFWDFGDGDTLTTWSRNVLPHTYRDTGTYIVKLAVDRNSSCGDSMLATVRVYPVLTPSFSFSGLCTTKPTEFTNTSFNRYGTIEYFRWDFGDTQVTNDTSNNSDPTYHYTQPGDYPVTLHVQTSKGCERTFTDTLTIYDKPPFTATNDTLLCYLNGLQFHAESPLPGTFTWTPLYNITGPLTANPYATPAVDTTYEVTFTDNSGCVNSKRIHVDVRDTLHVRTSADSTICTGDPIELKAAADGEYSFTWTDLNTNQVVGTDSIITVTPTRSVTYHVRVELGDCYSDDSVSFRAVDPPVAYAGLDTTICHGQKAVLDASGGAYYTWRPAGTLTSPNKPNTIAWPEDTTIYIVTVTDTLGCPKAVPDSVTVNVVPPVPAFAGNDTIIIKNQSFQLNASGGDIYRWSPPDGLDRTDIPNPVTSYNRDITYHLQVYTSEGCMGEDDISIRFMSGPQIYVPNAFTPNGDGVNDVFRPLPVGITKLESFRVYNRWGEEVFRTNEYMKGWDGKLRGRTADAGTYVWIVQGTNTTGELMEKRGTVTLIR